MALAPGTPAPDFALTLKPGEAPLCLADYRGQKTVVLLFFPLAFSSVCRREMEFMAESYAKWTALSAEILGISVDSAFVNQRFAAETEAPFPILSDFNREVVTAYGVRNDDFFGMRGVGDRSAFVIDRDGRIVYSWTSEDPDVMPPFGEMEEAVRSTGQGSPAF